MYTGTILARERIGNELAIKIIQYVIDNYRFNPKLQTALTRNTLYMVPCLNPDGFEYSRNHFSFWRKNRRNNGDGTFGVDLNRNFEYCPNLEFKNTRQCEKEFLVENLEATSQFYFHLHFNL